MVPSHPGYRIFASVASFKQSLDNMPSVFQMGHHLLEYGSGLQTAGQSSEQDRWPEFDTSRSSWWQITLPINHNLFFFRRMKSLSPVSLSLLFLRDSGFSPGEGEMLELDEGAKGQECFSKASTCFHVQQMFCTFQVTLHLGFLSACSDCDQHAVLLGGLPQI